MRLIETTNVEMIVDYKEYHKGNKKLLKRFIEDNQHKKIDYFNYVTFCEKNKTIPCNEKLFAIFYQGIIGLNEQYDFDKVKEWALDSLFYENNKIKYYEPKEKTFFLEKVSFDPSVDFADVSSQIDELSDDLKELEDDLKDLKLHLKAIASGRHPKKNLVISISSEAEELFDIINEVDKTAKASNKNLIIINDTPNFGKTDLFEMLWRNRFDKSLVIFKDKFSSLDKKKSHKYEVIWQQALDVKNPLVKFGLKSDVDRLSRVLLFEDISPNFLTEELEIISKVAFYELQGDLSNLDIQSDVINKKGAGRPKGAKNKDLKRLPDDFLFEGSMIILTSKKANELNPIFTKIPKFIEFDIKSSSMVSYIESLIPTLKIKSLSSMYPKEEHSNWIKDVVHSALARVFEEVDKSDPQGVTLALKGTVINISTFEVDKNKEGKLEFTPRKLSVTFVPSKHISIDRFIDCVDSFVLKLNYYIDHIHNGFPQYKDYFQDVTVLKFEDDTSIPEEVNNIAKMYFGIILYDWLQRDVVPLFR